MKDGSSAVKDVPRVLRQAKKSAQEKNESNSYDKGPWDKGHWSNRK